MKNIAIIGAGQLGSRHLQAVANIKSKVTIYIVDSSEESLSLSEKRFNEVNSKWELYSLKKISDLPKSIEFAVIATNSLQRLNALMDLVTHANVKYLILEKFLFPYEEEYKIAQKLLDNTQTKVFVNCAKAMWPKYQELRKLVSKENAIKINVSGNDWNMASNSIHFLNLLTFLTDSNNILVDTSLLDENLTVNKRAGYVEFTGTLKIIANNKHEVILTSKLENKAPFYKIEVSSKNFSIEINEIEENWSINGNKERFPICYQSNLTDLIFNQLEQRGECDLVEYSTSAKEHLLLLRAFNKYLGSREGIIT